MRLWVPALLTCALFAGCSKEPSATSAASGDPKSTATTSALKDLVKEDVAKNENPVASMMNSKGWYGDTPDKPLSDRVKAKEGDTVWVWYTGKLADGSVFDSRELPAAPVSFALAKGSLIDGWVEGLSGMKVGGERKLSVPSRLGYGSAGQGDQIPPNSDLFFDIKLAFVVHPGQETVFDYKDTKLGNGAVAEKGKTVGVLYRGFALGKKEPVVQSASPEVYTIGKGGVIPGLEYGVVGMKVGGKRTLLLPPMAAFGMRAFGEAVPANSPIIMEVELASVK